MDTAALSDKFVKTQALYTLIDYEPFVILIALVLFAWAFYKLFLREATMDRHKNIKNHFSNLMRHTLWFSVLFVVFKFIYQNVDQPTEIQRLLPYVGLATFCWGFLVFIKTSRLIILQYLFLGSMKAGVPILLVNIFSLILTAALLLWSASYLFGIQIGPLLATSAAFSIILGLALQDTLGNLFAGISLQLDRSFDIGDWLEVVNGSQKIIGQVQEITWRATIMTGWSDEVITLPNRTMANSQISNFQGGDQPIWRGQNFRVPLGTDVGVAKEALSKALSQVAAIRSFPAPLIFILEHTESWMVVRAVYTLDSYGAQYRVGDEVQILGLAALRAAGISVGRQVIEVLNTTEQT